MFSGGSDAEEVDVHSLLESLKQRKDESKTIPTCISSVIYKAEDFIIDLHIISLGLVFSLFRSTVICCRWK